MLCLTAESSSRMQFSEGGMFSTRRRTGKPLALTHTNLMQMDICAGTAKRINGAPKI